MAQKVNLVLDQGTTFSTSFTLRDDAGIPLDLSTYTGRSHMRKHYSSNNYYVFSVNASANGLIVLELPASNTTVITAGRYVYDVELVDGGNNVSRVIEGIVTVTPEVTR